MIPDVAELIRALPERPLYRRDELLTPQFQLAKEGRLTMYYAPLDFISPAAKLAIIGVTPGWTQMEISYIESRDERSSPAVLLRRRLRRPKTSKLRREYANDTPDVEAWENIYALTQRDGECFLLNHFLFAAVQ